MSHEISLLGFLLAGDSQDSPRGRCLDPNLVAGYVENHLARAERSLVEEHLADCSSCRQAIHFAVAMSPVEGGGEARDTSSRNVRFRFVVRGALESLETLVSGTIEVFTGRPLEAATVFRGSPEAETALQLHPYEVRLRWAQPPDTEACNLTVTGEGEQPLADHPVRLILESGETLDRRTDDRGELPLSTEVLRELSGIDVLARGGHSR